MGLGRPPKVMKNRFSSATTLSGSATLPFVISTEAQRSGEISMWMLLLGNVFLAEQSLGSNNRLAFQNPRRQHYASLVVMQRERKGQHIPNPFFTLSR